MKGGRIMKVAERDYGIEMGEGKTQKIEIRVIAKAKHFDEQPWDDIIPLIRLGLKDIVDVIKIELSTFDE